MLDQLATLARICTRATPTNSDIGEACRVIADALGAGDAYVLRAGDPAFVRLGCECDPSEYEIKQAGYWLVWRGLAEDSRTTIASFDTHGRIVSNARPASPGAPCSHLAAILPGDESNSDLLIVPGPWPRGAEQQQLHFLQAARPILAQFVTSVLDASRRARLRSQLESLANVAEAFNRANANEAENVLTELCTVLAKASSMDWVNIVVYNDAGDAVTDRAVNLARHSSTGTARQFSDRNAETSPTQLRLGPGLARTDGCILIPNVFEPGLEDSPSVELMREDIGDLQRFWKRAHVLSFALFPIVFQGSALGYLGFSSSTPRRFEPEEVEFLRALVSQAATVVRGLRLFQQLEESREELSRSEERFRSLVQNASDLITVVDEDSTITYQSPAIGQMLGYDADSVLGQRLLEFVHPEDTGLAMSAIERTIDGRSTRAAADLRMLHTDGSWRHVECIGSDQRSNRAIDGIVLNIRDVSERRELEDQLRDQALHDSLTGLANRASFTDRLDHALARSLRTNSQMAVLFLDLDNFKGVNDSLGHAAGDDLLVRVAQRVKAAVRPGDTVARLGGDEFAILIEDVPDPQIAVRAGDRLIEALAQPFSIGSRELAVHASIGIATTASNSSGHNREALLRDADVAMYIAKSEGKNCLRAFDRSMQTPMLERLELLAELPHAIEQGQFVLHYQPIFDLKSGRFRGAEALVRWAHPERGLVPPGKFIALAEESGAIVRLGHWVLEAACRQAAAWQKLYPDDEWALSLNVSSRQLQRPIFVEEVASVLQETGLPAARLTLEITESGLLNDIPDMSARLRELKALGVKLAVDDFGTGYSSLGYLREFPFDTLKIDRSFVADLGAEVRGRELARAIIELGRALGLELVAEGIERNDQLRRLRALGCGLGQGFHLARPMEPLALEKLLAARADKKARTAA